MSTASASPKYKEPFDIVPGASSDHSGEGIAATHDSPPALDLLRSAWTEPARDTVHAATLLTDLFLVLLNAYLIYAARISTLNFPWITGHREVSTIQGKEELALAVLYGTLTLLLGRNMEFYREGRHRGIAREVVLRFKAVVGATALLGSFLLIYGFQVNLGSILVLGMLNVATLAGWRIWRSDGAVRQRFTANAGARNVLIVGGGSVAHTLAAFLQANPRLGYTVRGFLDSKVNGDSRVLGTIEDFSRVVHTNFIDEVVVALPAEPNMVEKVAKEARRHHVNVKVVPEFYDSMSSGAQLETLGRYPLIALYREPIPQFSLRIKRAMDIVLATIALVLLSPLLLAIAIAIKLDSTGPVLYRALRAGKKGKQFTCYKFRTMVTEADALKGKLRQINERSGPFFKLANDPRLTRIGKWLRKYSLDEIPQFVNVLRGDMSIVGPRPHPLDDFERYAWMHLRRLSVLPGITGLWQVSARRDPCFEKTMELDLKYIEGWSLWMDLKILWRTLFAVLEGSGQ